MRFSNSPPSSKLAGAFIAVGSLLIIISFAYLRWSQNFELTVAADPRVSGAVVHSGGIPLAARVGALYTTLLATFLLLLVFLFGSFILARTLRIARARAAAASGPSEYVDVWRMYRLTEADLARATREDDDKHDPPRDEPGDADPGGPDPSDSGAGPGGSPGDAAPGPGAP